MTSAETASPHPPIQPSVLDAVAAEARAGLLAHPRTLSPWLFYDRRGSDLFEQITALPEYYLTRTERSIFTAHAADIIGTAAAGHPLTILELGAGTASKTGILLQAAVREQGSVLYQPVDVSPTALEEASANLQASLPGVTVHPQVANYTSEPLAISRPSSGSQSTRVLALYIGSSIGNFSPTDAANLLRNLRAQLRPADTLLLGTDLAPNQQSSEQGGSQHQGGSAKSIVSLLAAYDDAAGVTAAFNRNILHRLNRDLGANFDPSCFAHRARWNPGQSRIEMHLEALAPQHILIPENSAGPAISFPLNPGETIHTENSYKFTTASIASLLSNAGFEITRAWQDPQALFAVTLATAF